MASKADAESRDGTRVTRRSVLAALAAGGGASVLSAAATGNPDLQDIDGGLTLGGNAKTSMRSPYRGDGWYFGPATIPSEASEKIAWAFNDEPGVMKVYSPEPLPTTWTANGIQWSVASDLATAKNNTSQEPAVAIDASNDDAVLLAPDQLPHAWSAGGVSHVIDSTLEAARSANGGTAPAVLWGADGTWSVILDG